MRVRMFVLVAVGVICGATALQGQRPVSPGDARSKAGEPKAPRGAVVAEEDPVGTRAPAFSAVAVSPGKLDKLMPLLTAEAGGTGTPLDRAAQVGMNKQEYTAFRSSLMVARLDAQQPARLQGLTGTQLQVRQANLNVYNGNKTRLDAVLTKLEPEPGCALCTPGATTTTIIRR